MIIGKANWVMFMFGFLLDKINLFPFILGIFFGVYISKNIMLDINFSSIEIIFNYFKEYINSIFDEHTETKNENIKESVNISQEEKELGKD